MAMLRGIDLIPGHSMPQSVMSHSGLQPPERLGWINCPRTNILQEIGIDLVGDPRDGFRLGVRPTVQRGDMDRSGARSGASCQSPRCLKILRMISPARIWMKAMIVMVLPHCVQTSSSRGQAEW
jgi:hypothetical protein